jgi:hypothetical protein
MYFQFRVTRKGRTLFQNTFAVPDEDSDPMLCFARLAYASFKKVCPGASVTDPNISVEWLQIANSPLETNLPGSVAELRVVRSS